jgi:hypothetical protein
MNDQFITDGKEFFVEFTSPLVTGYMPVPIPKAEPILHWHGPRIDLFRSWQPALKFMADHAGHEVVLRLFMTRDRTEIIIFPLTQYHGTGMSVQEAILTEEREWWAAEGLTEAGTLHSHCSGAAFASGTDTNDEKTRDGLHVTIGKLRSDQYDIHARMTWTLPGEERDGQLVRASMTTTQSPNLSDWFILPEHVVQFIRLEPELENSVVKYCLTKPPGAQVQYPDFWNTKLIQKQPITQPWTDMCTLGHHQTELSMASDIPGFSKKKEESSSESARQKRADTAPAIEMMWDLWSEIMGLIGESSACRLAQVAVSDFAPEMRAHLFKQVPPAQIVWQAIKRLLDENGFSEKDFFNEFGK